MYALEALGVRPTEQHILWPLDHQIKGSLLLRLKIS